MKLGYSVLILFVVTSVTCSTNIISYDCFNPNNKLGLCISLYSCPTILKLFLNSPTKAENGTFLQQSYCKNGFGTRPFVCCSNDISYTTDIPSVKHEEYDILFTADVTSAKPEEDNTFKPKDNLPATQQQCSRTTEDNLSLAYFGFDRCFGALINVRYILTNAWCAKYAERILSKYNYVRFFSCTLYTNGAHDTNNNISPSAKCLTFGSGYMPAKDFREVFFIGKNTNGFKIETGIPHEKHNPAVSTYMYDIGLVRLSESVQFSKELAPSCLPSAVNGFKHYKIGDNITIPQRFEVLEQTGTIVENCCDGVTLQNQLCANKANELNITLVVRFGTPLIAHHNGAWIIDGISTYSGVACYPFTIVSYYEDWIISKIQP